jgi:hypothetical protein
VADDCSVEKVGKKACKNCSCGRAELEEKKVSAVLTASQINNPQSACGNVISFHISIFVSLLVCSSYSSVESNCLEREEMMVHKSWML